ncbi:MAG TPA: ATP-binding cassette domain-containing protein [Clostridiaceae bacterium]|nr:ATP-binding cassette domain-containing protein [Clostridiaceae bacterium]
MTAKETKFINLRAIHPSLLLLYFFSAVLFAMLTLNPAYLLVSFTAALLLNIYLQGAGKTLRSLRYFIPMLILVVVANALSSGNGLSVIFYLGNRPVTWESITYGFFAGLMLITILLWFRAYQEVATSDQLLAAGGDRFPVTTLMLGMVLRYVPDTVKHGQTVNLNQKALLGEEKLPRKEKISFFVRMSSVLMSWSMENAMETSIAMRAKGYPSSRRKTYKRDRFSDFDAAGIVFLLAMIFIQLIGFISGAHSFYYYPYLMLPADVPPLSWRILLLALYFLYLLFPFYLELSEIRARRKILRSEGQFSGRQNYGLLPGMTAKTNHEKGKEKTIMRHSSVEPTRVLYRESETGQSQRGLSTPDLSSPDLIDPQAGTPQTKESNNFAVAEQPGKVLQEAPGDLTPQAYDPAVAAELKRVSFAYPDTETKALNTISLSFKRGSMTLMTGASGSGKTTLLHLLSPALTPAGELSGERTIYGEADTVFADTERAVQIGFVQQNPDNQIILDSVWHELAFGLENQGLSNREIERRLAETSTFFGISDWMDSKVTELSGGEKQILNLASSLVMQPDLLLLDEPMAQLDPISRKRFLSMLGRVHDETGTTIVISEHIIDDVLPLADRVLMLDKGSVYFDGTAGRYVSHLLETDAEFKVSLPLSARMAAAYSKRAAATSYPALTADQNLPLTVRDGRQFLQDGMEAFQNSGPASRSLTNTFDPADESAKVSDTTGNAANTATEFSAGSSRAVPSTAETAGTFSKPVRMSVRSSDITDGSTLNNKQLSQSDPVLTVKDIWFRYEKNAPFVLRGASLTINQGELHALLGGNGSGKSTLMYILSRSLPALRGKITRPDDQQVAMLSQNPMAVFSQDSVRAELTEFQKRFAYDDSRIDEIMERFKLTHLTQRHPYDLSGGEMQKTALAKALLTKPDLLLLDEPVKGLDPVARREVAAILNELKQSGMTMVLITHDLDFISLLADRCSMLFDGHIEGTAETNEFFAGNAYFTTTAHRLTRGILPRIVTEDQLLSRMNPQAD